MKRLIEERGPNYAVFCAHCREFIDTVDWFETVEGVFNYLEHTCEEEK